ncbi:spore germination protein [Robertmurraya siralis]|uniref:spore germination protein n=1 Tax=Robertmurraya siralis TaxID=77777 RepID=UPI0010F9C15A|nr:spore germination protein [Robertmurraya siralis]
MDEVWKNLWEAFRENDDFFKIEQLVDDLQLIFFGLHSLMDFSSTIQEIEQVVTNMRNEQELASILQSLGQRLEHQEEAHAEILKGNLVCCTSSKKYFISIKARPRTLDRAVEAPANETILSGPRNSFTEDLSINLGLMRKELVTKDLIVNSFLIGEEHKKEVTLLYVKKKASKKLVESITEHLRNKKKSNLETMQDLMKLLGISTWTLIPKFRITELPHEASQALTKGKVVFIIDRIPFALVLPSQLSDMFFSENDRNFLSPMTLMLRCLRVIGIFVAVLAPGLYIALVSVNPEVLRIELALSIAQSREGVPYPALLEVLLMLLVLELIIEASVRLPKSIGPTITMVGGIILGQAAVDAKLVSNLLIIVLAATMIANSTVIGFQNSISIRLFKYIFVFLASIYGILGIFAGLFIICSYLSNIRTFDIPYIPLKGEQGDVI